MKIEKLDKNFRIETEVNKSDIEFFDCRQSQFKLYGVIPPESDDGYYIRMPEEIAKTVSQNIVRLNTHTSGGRIRFRTDSPYIAVNATLVNNCKMSHMPFSGSMGFDLYEYKDSEEIYLHSFITSNETIDEIFEFSDATEHEITLNMPLYSSVKRIYIGLRKDCCIYKPREYKYKLPVVYYGSSITQGGCASRPGNSYQGFISRMLDCNYINLGFSGNAKGETEMANYISKLEMSVFVYDYDHNAPSVEHLKNTHKAFFDIIRSNNRELPIIIVSRPVVKTNNDCNQRFEVIKKTYDIAVKNGDKNVYLIDGRTLMSGRFTTDGTVDGCHPNDLGFYKMALKIGKEINKVIKE